MHKKQRCNELKLNKGMEIINKAIEDETKRYFD
jgi:hypothetical protein